MGRMSAYTGKRVTWDEALGSEEASCRRSWPLARCPCRRWRNRGREGAVRPRGRGRGGHGSSGLGLDAPGPASTRYEFAAAHMGTTARILVYAPGPTRGGGRRSGGLRPHRRAGRAPQRLSRRQRGVATRRARLRPRGGREPRSLRRTHARPGGRPKKRRRLRRDGGPARRGCGVGHGARRSCPPPRTCGRRSPWSDTMRSPSTPRRARRAWPAPACAWTWAASPRAMPPTRRCAPCVPTASTAPS